MMSIMDTFLCQYIYVLKDWMMSSMLSIEWIVWFTVYVYMYEDKQN